MKIISHKITKAEIDYGIINMRDKDGTLTFFQNLPVRFTISLRGNRLFKRKLSANKVWIGYAKMRQFNVDAIIKISKKGTAVHIK